ncbi:hypothetical protein AN618_09080 [Fervidicola ferrireducens]|uniref:ECF transporter S component n=1 Tax=Fervidicola ferrireducens TaxID=520764 RepID=A0A140LAY5_9FIRM|nr:ECF transporter S component [Fervidicola ferrireducens]KXG77710.1 hypothetical protein AN618_09080 [Fervidicola ferrireducens]
MKKDTRFLTRTAILLGITLIVQYMKMPQLLTGSLVNAMLIIAGGTVGTLSGITIGLLTPVIAFLVGILKFPPMVPFIMAGNALYVYLYSTQRNAILRIALPSLAKYAWLSVSVLYILKGFGIKVPPPVVKTFTLPQLITALIGAAIGIAVTSVLWRSFSNEKM